MHIVRQLLQNELENSDSRPLIRISRTRSVALQIPFSSMVEKVQKNQITYRRSDVLARSFKQVYVIQCDTWILILGKTSL